MAKSLKDNLRLAAMARAKADQAVRARMDSMEAADAVRTGAGEAGQAVPAPETSAGIVIRDSLPDLSAGNDDRSGMPDIYVEKKRRTGLPDSATVIISRDSLPDRTTVSPGRDTEPEPSANTGSRDLLPESSSAVAVCREPLPAASGGNALREPCAESSARTGLRKHPPEKSAGNGYRSSLPEFLDAAESLLPDKPLVRTQNQKNLLAFLEAHPNITTTYARLSSLLGQKKNTVRDGLATLAKAGRITKEAVHIPGTGVVLNIRLAAAEAVCRDSLPEQSAGSVRRSWLPESAPPTERGTLALSQERVALTWPSLAAAGFGQNHLEQIAQALAELGRATDRVVQGLDHAEWELERGRMRDNNGDPVADPCAWVFRSLARTGYYPRPRDYVSPEEQALFDAEDTAKALLAARQRVEQTRLAAWKAGPPGGERDGSEDMGRKPTE